jgi:hypothetical protein
VLTRQAALDAAYATHLERFVRRRPRVARPPPAIIAINTLTPDAPILASTLLEESSLGDLSQAIAT